ncbi:MAG: glycosyltransferase family 4 protein [Coriobacteriia bacterium]
MADATPGPENTVSSAIPSARKTLRVAMLLHGQYPWDERVKREAQALVAAGHEVDVFCLKQTAEEASRETVDGVTTRRLPLRRVFTHGHLSYFFEYAASFIGFLASLTAGHRKRRYDVVQVHTLPDVLVFAAVFAKLGGACVVLDMHDLMPELYRSKYGLAEDSRAVSTLRRMERWSTSYADHVITASEAFRDRLVSAGVPAEKVTVVLNTADPQVFPAPAASETSHPREEFQIFWHGTMVRRYGLDLALEAIALARKAVPEIHFVVYGEGECADDLAAQARQLELEPVVDFRGHVSHLELAEHIRGADLGIVPNRPDVHIDMAYPTKLFEFVQMGVPVLATRTAVLQRMFDDGSIVFCEPTAQDIAQSIIWIHENPEAAREAAQKARERCEAVSWKKMSRIYIAALERIATH